MAVQGVRGTGVFGSVERPQNWRQGILLAFPNGDAPLTAMLGKAREMSTDDPQYHWFEKGLPVQRGAIRGAQAGAPPVTDDGDIAANQTADVWLKIRPDGSASDDVSIFKVGHVILNETTEEALIIVAVDVGNAAIKVRRDVGNKFGTNPAITGSTTTGGDFVTVIGEGNPEGAVLGQAIAFAPVRQFNFTQIFRTPLAITRTARRTRLRWDDQGAYREAKREALQMHSIQMEKAFLFGEREEITSFSAGVTGPLDITSTGQPLRTTRGMLNWLPVATTTSISVNTNLTAFNSGVLTEAIWDQFLEVVFRYGSKEKVAFCGSMCLLVLTQLAKNKGTIDLVPTDQTYGFHLLRYITPFGTLMLYGHPLMSDNPTWRQDMFILDLDKLVYRYVDDTRFLTNRQAPGEDASRDEFLTECGLEVHFTGATPDAQSPNLTPAPAAHGRLKGIATYGG